MLTMESLADEIAVGRRSTRSSSPFPTSRGGRSASGSPVRSSSTTSPATASRSATTCSPATSTWSRSPATASPTGRPATATSGRWSTPTPSARCHGSREAPSCSATSSTMAGEPVEVSPRRMLRRQIERAAERGLRGAVRDRARVLPLPRLLRAGGGQALAGSRPPSRAASRTTSSSRRHARSTSIARRSATRCSRRTSPIEYSKGEAGVGQHEVNVTYGGALETADRHLVFKSGVKEIAARARTRRHLHGQVVDGDRRVLLPPPLEPLGRGDRRRR